MDDRQSKHEVRLDHSRWAMGCTNASQSVTGSGRIFSVWRQRSRRGGQHTGNCRSRASARDQVHIICVILSHFVIRRTAAENQPSCLRIWTTPSKTQITTLMMEGVGMSTMISSTHLTVSSMHKPFTPPCVLRVRCYCDAHGTKSHTGCRYSYHGL